MNAICVIPARYASTRFPGKPLVKILDKPMIQWVYQRAKKARGFQQVLVATDDQRIAEVVRQFGGQVRLTPPDLTSGTDRVAKAVEDLDVDIVVNLQGDEPLIQPELLDELIAVFEKHSEVQVATPIKRITHLADLVNPNLVRVVKDKNNYALYFTRSIIPYLRDIPEQHEWIEKFTYYKHVGIYAYRKQFLIKLSHWNKGKLEMAEKLEQLRILEHGYKIFTLETDYESISVDTPEDLDNVIKRLKANEEGRV